ncbi:MAG TPA: VTT domain-containing protein [Terriglobales bacterium]|nr:VTT domain-containing protein [Terriglobales bacterium]
MSPSNEWAHTLGALARSLGLVGIFALTLFDGSLLWLLPGINDIILISFVIAKRTLGWAALAVVAATLGSVLGAIASYRIGRRGGAELLRKRFPPGLLRRVEYWTARLGAIPVGVAAVMPPPFPYAPFVFSAGIMKVPKNRFRFSVALGRGVRYALDAALALYLGRHLLKHLDRFYWDALEPTLIAVGVALLVWGLLRLRAARSGAQEKLW